MAEFAAGLARAPQASVRLAKRTLRAALARTLDACLDAEDEAQRVCWESPDLHEGLTAFVDKRAPRFGGMRAASDPMFASSMTPRFE